MLGYISQASDRGGTAGRIYHIRYISHQSKGGHRFAMDSAKRVETSEKGVDWRIYHVREKGAYISNKGELSHRCAMNSAAAWINSLPWGLITRSLSSK